jgi:hypothetical protein
VVRLDQISLNHQNHSQMIFSSYEVFESATVLGWSATKPKFVSTERLNFRLIWFQLDQDCLKCEQTDSLDMRDRNSECCHDSPYEEGHGQFE